MQALQKILLLLFAVKFPLDSIEKTGSSDGWAAIESLGHSQVPLNYPPENPHFYPIHHQAESPAEVTNRIPQSQPTTEQQHEPFRSSAPESALERRLIFCIRFGNEIEPGLTILKLIFPFHFFL